jgi:DNA polymerase elongation subunit (family B)
MAFICNDIDIYLKIRSNPKFGIKLIQQQQIHEKRKRLVKSIKTSKNNDGNDEESQNSDDEGYASDASELDRVDLDEGGMFGDNDSLDDDDNSKKIHNEDLEFQILDTDFYHTEDDNDKKLFNMMLFGKTKDDRSVTVNVEGFCPFFYIEIDSRWRMPIIRKIIQDVQKKIYKKHLRDGLLKCDIIQAHKFHGFTDDADISFLHLVFNDYDSMREHARAFEKKHELPYVSRNRKMTFKLYESNIHPIIRFFHTQNIDPIGWCKISKDKFKRFKVDHRKGVTDINVNCNWRDVVRSDCPDIHKFKILSFDIECTSEDGKFPHNRDGDKVIQIGMTYSYLGEQECYKKVVLCLKKTGDVDDSIVKSYSDEIKLMLGFTSEIYKEDPDVITGYNIFGFDFPYLRDRAKKFGIENQFSKLSRVKGLSCNFVEQQLVSSAMGRNNLKYYNTPGRVCIDLMKYIQREHKLSAYGLDAVAGNFIRDKVEKFEYIREGDKLVSKLSKCVSKEDEEDNNENDENEDNEDNNEDEENEEDNNEENNKNKKDNELDEDAYYSTDEDEDEVIGDDDDIHIKKKNKDNSKKKKVLYTKLLVKSTTGIKKDDYIALYYNDGPTDNKIGKKYRVLYVDDKSIILANKLSLRQYLKRGWKVFWCQAKDDVGPKDIFRLFKGSSFDRARVAKYCLKDSSLCNRLMAKLQILPNSIGMGNVCCVPLPYIFLRGQSIKIFSLVAKQCREEKYLIPTVKKKFKKQPQKDAKGKIIETEEQKDYRRHEKFVQALIKDDGDDDDDDEDEDKYEGATVFEPITGVHYEPIIVGDYSSLYPSSMIMKNLSHNSIILDPKYDNLPGYKYHEQSYKNSDGSLTTCRFAEKIGDDPMKTKAIIPRILMKLLATRKKYNFMKEEEKDPFKKAVWDGLQIAYKVTANSLYGQCGSPISPIAMKAIAACTTSIGRDMLERAKEYVENEMKTIINLIKDAVETKNDKKFLKFMREFYTNVSDKRVVMKEKVMGPDGKPVLENEKPKEVIIYNGKEEYYMWLKKQIYELVGKYNIDPKCIYGDTDSVFFKLNMTEKETGVAFRDHDALKISIKMGIIVTGILNYTFDYPQGLAYEKVYWPFIIISKKRYVGNLYSTKPTEFYQKSMGLVTKRRDNADIVKVIVGGIIDQILNKRSSIGAVKFTKSTLMKIITGKYNIDKFIISKTLKDKEVYADWTKQVHVVLAERMAARDPGNKPQSNDRIPFVYIETAKKAKLQGEKVEHPQYIAQKGLKIDYLFYITNQIMKPSLQFLELIVKDPDKIFNMYIIREENRKAGMDPIYKYYKDCPTNEGNIVAIKGMSSEDIFGTPTPQKSSKVRKRIEKRIKTKKIF